MSQPEASPTSSRVIQPVEIENTTDGNTSVCAVGGLGIQLLGELNQDSVTR